MTARQDLIDLVAAVEAGNGAVTGPALAANSPSSPGTGSAGRPC